MVEEDIPPNVRQIHQIKMMTTVAAKDKDVLNVGEARNLADVEQAHQIKLNRTMMDATIVMDKDALIAEEVDPVDVYADPK